MANFIYRKQLENGTFDYILTTTPPRLALQQYPTYELYRQFNDPDTAKSYYESLMGIVALKQKTYHKKKKKPWRMTRARKRGYKNKKQPPHTEATKRKIARSKKYQGLGGTFSATRKAAISWGLRKHYAKRPRRRCVDLDGKEHLVDVDFVLPEGWCYGRPRGKGGGRPLGVGNVKGTKRQKLPYTTHVPYKEY